MELSQMLFLTTKKLAFIFHTFHKTFSQNQSPHNISVFARKLGLKWIVLLFGHWQTSHNKYSDLKQENSESWEPKEAINMFQRLRQVQLLPHINQDFWDFEQRWNYFYWIKRGLFMFRNILSSYVQDNPVHLLKAWLLFIKQNSELIGFQAISYCFPFTWRCPAITKITLIVNY